MTQEEQEDEVSREGIHDQQCVEVVV